MHDLFSHHCQKYIYQVADNKDFGVNLILAIITLLAVFVALFRDWILSCIFKPKLTFETAPATLQDDKGTPYKMYRLLVTNDGNASAQDVRALIANVIQPLNLNWTSRDDKITRNISKHEPAYLDVIQEKHGKFYFYPWADLINSPDYKLSATSTTKIEINFYEKSRVLQSVTLELDPVAETLSVL